MPGTFSVIPRRGGALRLLTHDERDAVWNVFGVSPRTGQMRAFTRFTSSNGYVRYPMISRDGPHIVFERNILGGNVWTAQLQ